jgi:hypothetical protein
MTNDEHPAIPNFLKLQRTLAPQPAPSRPTLVYDFPIDNRYTAQLVLPRDLTRLEADRLCAFIRTLAAP